VDWGKLFSIWGGISILFFASCNLILFRVEGVVVDFNGEPLPGVCVASPDTSDYAITDANGKFYFTSRKPISKIEFIKSDYLPIQVEIPKYIENKVNLGKVTLILKPFSSGVYFYDKSQKRYVMLSYSQVKRVKLDENNILPGVALDDIVQVKSSPISFYVHRMPHYDIKMYKLKGVEVKVRGSPEDASKNKSEKDKPMDGTIQVLVPDRPVMVHTQFISTIDSSLFLLEPLDDLSEGFYCINWGAFETPFPKVIDNYLFKVVKEDKGS